MSIVEGISRSLGDSIIGGHQQKHFDYNHATDDHYKQLRDQARQAQNMHEKYASEAKAAYNHGNKAEAAEWSQKSKQCQADADRLNSEAAQWVFRANNGDSKPDEIDLHGLFVKEALSCLDSRVYAGINRGEDHIQVIVGKGIHSENHIAKLKPAVEEYCNHHGLRWTVEKKNTGVIMVQLPPGGQFPQPGPQGPQGGYQGGYQGAPQGGYQGYVPPQQGGYGQGGYQQGGSGYQQHHGSQFNAANIQQGLSILGKVLRLLQACFR